MLVCEEELHHAQNYPVSAEVRRLEMVISKKYFGLPSGLALISRHSGNGTFEAEVNGKMFTVPPQ